MRAPLSRLRPYLLPLAPHPTYVRPVFLPDLSGQASILQAQTALEALLPRAALVQVREDELAQKQDNAEAHGQAHEN
jgi:hypothetical protein